MGTRLRGVLAGHLGELRHEPTPKRVRARLADRTVVDSTRAMLVWEPRCVVPTYAVPAEDVAAEIDAQGSPPPTQPRQGIGFALPDVTDVPVLDPSVPFGVHSIDGEPVELRVPGARAVAGFRPSDPDLSGYVILDFGGFDTWLEEDEEIVSHPRDPFHRVDVRASSRHVKVTLDGHVLAETSRPRLVFETMLPVRKGEAAYWSVDVGGRVVEDLVWGYQDPLPDAAALKGYLSFFDERIDLVVDGTPRDRPVTPWS